MDFVWDFSLVIRNSDMLIAGAIGTFKLAGAAFLISAPLGLMVAIVRLARIPLLSWIAVVYTNIFRTTPALVLIFWVFFALPILLRAELDTFTSASLALGLQSGAYFSEVFRGGILSIKPGQSEAARALGMTPATTMTYIIVPQALLRIIPIFFTRVTELFKTTSLAAAISYGELLQMASRVSSETYRPVEIFTTVALFFFLVLFCASQGVRLLERRFPVRD